MLLNKVVRRGYINRYARDEYWVEEVIPVKPGLYLSDGDAIPYYIEGADGTLSPTCHY